MITASDKVVVPICSIVVLLGNHAGWLYLGSASAKKTNQFTREFISKLDAVLPNVLEERRRRVGNNLGDKETCSGIPLTHTRSILCT